MKSRSIHYKRVGNKRYVLLEQEVFYTQIEGYDAVLEFPVTDACSLSYDGTLTVKSGFVWDMASGAIDTPDMAVASLAHDALCRLIKKGQLPTSTQKPADVYFRRVLKAEGCGWFRRWYAYWALRAYSHIK